ncbi:penicillin-binding transpeptidase domain-containing protein [Solirubrobacter ginsenosidimutans]|uniref:Penicillin-binding transpeptidase domain-containing protein n=1 Tax=Solirubrobacter ginsenosidimutans TaxID=490573 RepID=A0A9X3RZF9_9ACTN|nr:penicillin-binding transpeptidase domain-containing protein [Solirubrobacter ginsenosidimutans]MDA0160109.1 penicillin-binding transpeptidase domain-containing protein [Solirubrobacter ginsenosidimutans]
MRRTDERVPPITPQLAWRVAVLGAVAFLLFATVFFRLWSLQVLSGSRFVAQARDNGRRVVPIEAPRGDIVDRNDHKLVTTRRAAVVQIAPASLPAAVRTQGDDYHVALADAENARARAETQLKALERQLRDDGHRATKAEHAATARLRAAAETAKAVPIPPLPATEPELAQLYARIGRVLQIRPETVHGRVIRGLAEAPYTNVTIRTDVPRAEFDYMRERPQQFPGVVITDTFLREYPHGSLAAQLFGTVSQEKGQSGLEQHYDEVLRGVPGKTRLTVDASGQLDESQGVKVTEPKQGDRLQLTLDLGLQQAGDAALAKALSASKYPTRAGAWLAMDPRNGAVYGMGSAPSFDASKLAKPFSDKTYQELTSQAQDAPLLNRVTESAYPTGSTFKPVTAFAALEGGLINPSYTIDDTGHWALGTQKYQNANQASFGTINVADALKVSSDIFFFQLGAAAEDHDNLIQRWAKRFGFGSKTGIDLPGESPGLVPDSAWRTREYKAYAACVDKAHLLQNTLPALYKCGGIDKPWTPGDNVNLAVGQGDLQATPLQLAVAYSAIANDGTIVKPHLGLSVEDGNGFPIHAIHTDPRRKIKLSARDRQVILGGLKAATTQPDGTSADVFKGWPKRYTVYGKTGTAERGVNPDQAWYACFVNDPERPIVVVVTVEKGGFGAETAAPAARLILSKWFGVKDNAFHAGTSDTL